MRVQMAAMQKGQIQFHQIIIPRFCNAAEMHQIDEDHSQISVAIIKYVNAEIEKVQVLSF